MPLEPEQLTAAARRGIDWIIRQQRPDGSFCNVEDGVGAYYKVPYTLALAGERRAALRLMQWAAHHHAQPNGDFRAPQRKAHEIFHEQWPVYANAWLILGAQTLGYWELAARGLVFLRANAAPAGGFIAREQNDRFVEPVCTAWGGLAALACGDHDLARRSGDALVQLVNSQPRADHFYSRMSLHGELLTAVPDGKSLQYYVDVKQPKQIYYNPGIALILLVHLARASGSGAYLAAARRIFAFCERCADDVYRFPPSGKLGLGCALLAHLTGDDAARRAALAVGSYLVETQRPDGTWRLPDEALYAIIADKEGFDVQLDLYAEFNLFLLEIGALVE